MHTNNSSNQHISQEGTLQKRDSVNLNIQIYQIKPLGSTFKGYL